MTRPKVPEDKRQRTAQACDTCKRRKQKVSPTFVFHTTSLSATINFSRNPIGLDFCHDPLPLPSSLFLPCLYRLFYPSPLSSKTYCRHNHTVWLLFMMSLHTIPSDPHHPLAPALG